MKKCCSLDLFTALLVFIGALNWGLVGAFNYNLVEHIFGGGLNIAVRIIYVLVGLCGIYGFAHFIHAAKKCCKKGKSCD